MDRQDIEQALRKAGINARVRTEGGLSIDQYMRRPLQDVIKEYCLLTDDVPEPPEPEEGLSHTRFLRELIVMRWTQATPVRSARVHDLLRQVAQRTAVTEDLRHVDTPIRELVKIAIKAEHRGEKGALAAKVRQLMNLQKSLGLDVVRGGSVLGFLATAEFIAQDTERVGDEIFTGDAGEGKLMQAWLAAEHDANVTACDSLEEMARRSAKNAAKRTRRERAKR